MEGSKNAITHIKSSLRRYMGYTIEDKDHIDPMTKLSVSQKSHLKSSWISVTSKSNLGWKLMTRFLEKHPEHQRFFDFMLTKNKEGALGRHVDKVMSALTCIVDNVNDGRTLMGTLQRLANSHHRLGVGVQEFKDLCSLLIHVLKEELGVDFTSKVEEAWNVALKTVCDVVAGEINDMDNQ